MFRLLLNNIQVLISIVYLVLASSILLVKLIKPLNDLLLYGKTFKSSNTTQTKCQKLIHIVSSQLRVPKQYFTHFYVSLSVSSSIIYLIQYPMGTTPDPIKYKNLSIINVLLWCQGIRRFYECLFITKFSNNSYINISHYIAGISHYILISLSCYFGLKLYSTGESISIRDLDIYDWLLILGYFALAKGQFDSHSHLSSLVKYTLPNFKYVASPHYFQEILIYMILFVFSIKNGWDIVSRNFLCGLIFVGVNLSMSSIETYKYYQEKFKEKFTLNWCIFPGVL